MNVNVQTPQGLEAPVPLSVRFVYGHVDAIATQAVLKFSWHRAALQEWRIDTYDSYD